MLWNASLETGIREIDEQHKELFRRVETLLEAGMQQKGKEKIREILDFLSEYVVVHFRDEERMQQLSRYPKYLEHKATHDRYVQEVQTLIAQLEREGETLNIVLATNRSVVDWLINHISLQDRDFAQYLKKEQQ